ncbi:hypothetical protein [Burkholderia cepacia]|uniref:hypothetical protein n=1 Tax=Burkholderia cepacia TaxID=292 RepID=UPI00398F4805
MMRTASRPFLLRFFAPAQCAARDTGTDRLRRAFNRLIMLDFGDGPVRGGGAMPAALHRVADSGRPSIACG